MIGQIELRILGPVEARLNGARLPLRRRKQRALLALLACDANRVVSVDRIVDELWPDDLPAGARHSVEVYASGLRKLLGEGRLERRGGGYVLALQRGELDAERLATLVEQARAARPARARRLLEEGLALVRGEPLADLEVMPFAQVERARLAELMATAREALVEARLALGEHDGLVPELRALCAAEPTREPARAQLMLALYRAGRHEEALATYREGRQALRNELGVEPGAELRELERQILRQDARLAAPPATSPPANLPAPLHPLLGRERELVEVADLLRADARLVTLTGIGGVGKTRLAAALAHELLPEFEDGACFVALAPVREPELLPSAVAHALHVAEVPGEPLSTTLASHLRGRELLLVVDNLEHLVERVSLLTELLGAASDLRVLATSRTPLRLYGEHLYPLEPLGLPPPAAAADEIARAPAVALFAARSRAVRPGFAVTAESADSVAEICIRLEGLPLAIELAAARGALLSPALLLERLTSRLDAGDGPRDVPERQRTLRSTLDWTYDLLAPPEQALFRRLGVFVGGATEEAARSVCGLGGTSAAAFPGLVVHGLVQHVAGDRYVPLETVREYALERLEDSGELERTRMAHVAYFVELAEAAEPRLTRDQPAELVAQLNAEHANLLAAAGSAAEASRGDLELRLLAALGYYFTLRGTVGEGARLLESALARNPTQPPGLRARAAVQAAALAVYDERRRDAERLAHESLRLNEDADDDFVAFKAFDVLAYTATMAGDLARGRTLHERAVAFARSSGDLWALGTVFNNVVVHLFPLKAYDEARAALEENLECFTRLGNADGMAYAHANLAIVAAEQARPPAAAGHLEHALACARDRDRPLAFDLLGHVAELAHTLGDSLAAARLLGAHEQRASLPYRAVDEYADRARRRAEEGVRSQLDPQHEAQARAEGGAMTFEQAVDYALAVCRRCAKRASQAAGGRVGDR